jgi:hypothetical protein
MCPPGAVHRGGGPGFFCLFVRERRLVLGRLISEYLRSVQEVSGEDEKGAAVSEAV